jgi:hypothetical protein
MLVAEEVGQYSRDAIDVLLTTAPTLSTMARASMIDEATTIWRRQGVDIKWLPATADRPVASNRLRVLIVQKRLSLNRVAEPVPIGELVQPVTGHPFALISIEGAQQLMSSVRGRAGYALISRDERRLGMVLGRALAHEIGHYLLGTHTHARNGLMRPNFNALEFADLRSGTFELDHDAATWLRSRSGKQFAYSRP